MESSKERLLNSIARNAYNIGYGADKHFFTYNFYRVVPNLVSLLALAVSIYQVSRLSTNLSPIYGDILSYVMILVALIGFYVGLTARCLDKYKYGGEELTAKFNELQRMYTDVQCSETVDVDGLTEELGSIVSYAKDVAITDHPILISDWAAHVLFFAMRQTDWVVKERNLTFFKDMIPASFKVIVGLLVFLSLVVWWISHLVSEDTSAQNFFLIPSHLRLCWIVNSPAP